MFNDPLLSAARELLALFRKKNYKLATAESCTGGLVAGLLTTISGSSDIFERGFVVYSNEAKQEMLSVPQDMLARCGAVSNPVARAMAEGALKFSRAHVAISITGIAGPGGATPDKPIGLVWFGLAHRRCIKDEPLSEVFEQQFHLADRNSVRLAATAYALTLARRGVYANQGLNAPGWR